MQVNKLICANFRNIENVQIEPHKRMNVICGENAQGKTNLLESIWLYTGAKSFRAVKDSSFIKLGEQRAKTTMQFLSRGIENTASMEFREKRSIILNDKALQNPAKLAGYFSAVVFSPTDLMLLSGGPDKRRKFLDLSIGQLYPAYIDLLYSYMRSVKQRNSLIKALRTDGSVSFLIDSFEDEIALTGEKIIKYRADFIEKMKKYIPEIFGGISSGQENAEISYITSSADSLRQALQESRKTDILTGTTSVGPHRDDIDMKINGLSAKAFGSQGQKRSCALSLKFAFAEIVNELCGEYPVCLLDDVMSELDKGRQNYILNHIKNMQSFITCCDSESISGLCDGAVFNVSGGRVI